MLLQGCAFQQVISGSSSIKGFDEKFTEVVLDKELFIFCEAQQEGSMSHCQH